MLGVDGAAYADLLGDLPWLAERQEILKLKSEWRITGLELAVVDVALTYGAVVAIERGQEGLLAKIAQLQDVIRGTLRAQGFPYPPAV